MPKRKHWFMKLPPEAADDVRQLLHLPNRVSVVVEHCFYCHTSRILADKTTQYRSPDGEWFGRVPPCIPQEDRHPPPSQRIMEIAGTCRQEFARAAAAANAQVLNSPDTHILTLSIMMFLDEAALDKTICDEEIRDVAQSLLRGLLQKHQAEIEAVSVRSVTKGIPS
jgi:hypothetical protein